MLRVSWYAYTLLRFCINVNGNYTKKRSIKKTIFIAVAFFICALVAADFGAYTGDASHASSDTSTSNSTPNSNSMPDIQVSAVGDIEVEDNLFDVTITLPADFSEGVTQESLDASTQLGKFHSAVLNADGTVTYTMSKTQHKKMLQEMSDSIRQSLSEMIQSADYPNITGIEANDDFTQFKVTTTSTELSLNESFSVMAFYMQGGYYGAFSGNKPDNIHVDFINTNTGAVISSADSKDAGSGN